jgi:hypothetical protein
LICSNPTEKCFINVVFNKIKSKIAVILQQK